MTAPDLDALDRARRRALSLRGLVAECSCCGATYTLPAWLQLRFVGIQDDVGDGEPIELRDCEGPCCRSTLAVPVALCSAWLEDLRAINAVKAQDAERLLRHEERHPVDRARELYSYCRGYRDCAVELGLSRQRVAKLEQLTLITNALLNRAITDRAVERQRARITPAGEAAVLAFTRRPADPVVEALLDDSEPMLSAERDNRDPYDDLDEHERLAADLGASVAVARYRREMRQG